jgi:hypothetical protein
MRSPLKGFVLLAICALLPFLQITSESVRCLPD